MNGDTDAGRQVQAVIQGAVAIADLNLGPASFIGFDRQYFNTQICQPY